MEKENIVLPDYNHSILNLISSILHYYQVENNHAGLPMLDKMLENNYENVVLMILDGMGDNVLSHLVPNGFLQEHKQDVITTIYPSTTVAALTTYFSGKAPVETGWIALSQYFKEYGRSVDMLSCEDTYTKDALKGRKKQIYDLMAYKPVYAQIEEKNEDVKTYEIKPGYCEFRASQTMNAKDMKELCQSVTTLCMSKGRKYICAYNDIPDKTLHRKGTYSNEVKEFLEDAQKEIEKMCEALQGTNTLLIVCADHGHTPISHIYSTLEGEDFADLEDLLFMPPAFENRLTTFWVKRGREEEFKEKFLAKWQQEFILYTKQEFFDSHLLGEGLPHPKLDDFVGDFVAIAISDAMIKIETEISKEKYNKVSNHCGLTKDEMEVPLIIVDLK